MAQQKAAKNRPQDATGIDLGADLAESSPSGAAAAASLDVHELATPSGLLLDAQMTNSDPSKPRILTTQGHTLIHS